MTLLCVLFALSVLLDWYGPGNARRLTRLLLPLPWTKLRTLPSYRGGFFGLFRGRVSPYCRNVERWMICPPCLVNLRWRIAEGRPDSAYWA